MNSDFNSYQSPENQTPAPPTHSNTEELQGQILQMMHVLTETQNQLAFSQSQLADRGSFRLCVDYRGLNSVTKKNAAPLPSLQEIRDRLIGNCIFSTMDALETVFTTSWYALRIGSKRHSVPEMVTLNGLSCPWACVTAQRPFSL
jgi:hypothetical protein